MATHSSVLAWKIPWTEEPGRLQSLGSQRQTLTFSSMQQFSEVSFRFKPLRVFRRLSSAAAAKSLQSCPTLCKPIDGSLPGSSVLGILQARTLEWVAISFSSA